MRRLWLAALFLFALPPGALCAEPQEAASFGPPAPAAAPPPPQWRYALLLPLNAPAYRAAADALRAGFVAAAAVAGEARFVTVIAHGDKEATLAYQRALGSGAQVVIGPLVRDDVNALLGYGGRFTATLLLNLPERAERLPAGVAALALSAEGDARQLARLAAREGRQKIMLVGANSPFQKRVQAAFADEARALGMGIAGQAVFNGDTAELQKLRARVEALEADALMIALDAPEARVLRGYLSALPAYASGQVFDGIGATGYFELNNLRYVELPWLAQLDHAAVMAYPRPELEDATLQRLYALGIDAYRVANELARAVPPEAVALDGVTGQIAGSASGILSRESAAMIVRDGEVQALQP